MNVYFFQCQEDYNGNMYIPYSSGILWSYVSQFDEIKDNYTLCDIFFEKIDPNQYIEKLKINPPNFALFSNYGWNTRYHLSIAKLVKEHFPTCTIIIGGPNAQQDQKYLREHDYVDISVWGEGEQTLLELFQYFVNKNVALESIKGISYIDNNNNYVLTPIRERFKDVNVIPSPYLNGIFDNFYERYDYNFMPVWETNRGCPYSCTFCDLGNDYYSKLFTFDDQRLLDEIDFFSEKKTEYIEIADANFGIVKRDLELTKYIKKKHVETGYPQKISATWAKSSPDRLFEMSKILESINRSGITLALQSSNKTALGNIKRTNIANEKLEEISKKYAENNMQTYHDFIIGLPGETLNSWKDGLLYVVDINPEGWIFGHPLEAYKNTEFSDPNYINMHKLKFVTTPQVSFFAQRKTNVPIEYGNYVVETNTLSTEDYIECFLFKWFLISVHSLGWANFTAHNMAEKASEFYLKLYDWMRSNNSLLQDQYNETKNSLMHTLQGNFWGRQMFGDDDIYWEYESASCIVFEKNRDRFFDDLKRFVKETYPLKDLNIVDENDNQVISFNRHYNHRKTYANFKEFCIEIYWYGRRKRAWKV